MAFRKLMQVVERRGPMRRAILALLEGDARDKAFWTDQAVVSALAGHLRTPEIATEVVEDPEHQALAVSIDDRSAGYSRKHRLDLDFVTTGEFRTLLAAYREIRELMTGAVTIRTVAAATSESTESRRRGRRGGDRGRAGCHGQGRQRHRPQG
jgi:hypothetical protein